MRKHSDAKKMTSYFLIQMQPRLSITKSKFFSTFNPPKSNDIHIKIALNLPFLLVIEKYGGNKVEKIKNVQRSCSISKKEQFEATD